MEQLEIIKMIKYKRLEESYREIILFMYLNLGLKNLRLIQRIESLKMAQNKTIRPLKPQHQIVKMPLCCLTRVFITAG